MNEQAISQPATPGLRRGPLLLAGYLVVAIGGLLILRAFDERFDFLPVGWIIVLAIIPILPWVLPRALALFRDMPRYVQSFKVGSSGVELAFRDAQSNPIAVPTGTGPLSQIPNDFGALSSSTAITILVTKLHELRRQGGGPVAIIDLQDGRKWRLPNLYFLARLLELQPGVVEQLVVTESRGGIDGYLVGSILPEEFRQRVEQALPEYATASASQLAPITDLTNLDQAQQVAVAFGNFVAALPPPSLSDDDPLHGYLTVARVQQLVAGTLSTAAVDGPGATLGVASLQIVIESTHQYVPTTQGGRLSGLIDRNLIALAVARITVAANS